MPLTVTDSDIGKGVLRILLLAIVHLLPLVELTHGLLLHLLREGTVGIVLISHSWIGHERVRLLLLSLHISEWISCHLIRLLHLHADVGLEVLGHHVHHLVLLLLLLLHHHHLRLSLILFMAHWVGNESGFLLLSARLLLILLSWHLGAAEEGILHHARLLLLVRRRIEVENVRSLSWIRRLLGTT